MSIKIQKHDGARLLLSFQFVSLCVHDASPVVAFIYELIEMKQVLLVTGLLAAFAKAWEFQSLSFEEQLHFGRSLPVPIRPENNQDFLDVVNSYSFPLTKIFSNVGSASRWPNKTVPFRISDAIEGNFGNEKMRLSEKGICS